MTFICYIFAGWISVSAPLVIFSWTSLFLLSHRCHLDMTYVSHLCMAVVSAGICRKLSLHSPSVCCSHKTCWWRRLLSAKVEPLHQRLRDEPPCKCHDDFQTFVDVYLLTYRRWRVMACVQSVYSYLTFNCLPVVITGQCRQCHLSWSWCCALHLTN